MHVYKEIFAAPSHFQNFRLMQAVGRYASGERTAGLDPHFVNYQDGTEAIALRYSRKARVLLQHVMVDENPCLLILDDLPHHEYEKVCRQLKHLDFDGLTRVDREKLNSFYVTEQIHYLGNEGRGILNAQQKEALRTFGGYSMYCGGPGAGKTTVALISMLNHPLCDNAGEPSQLLYVANEARLVHGSEIQYGIMREQQLKINHEVPVPEVEFITYRQLLSLITQQPVDSILDSKHTVLWLVAYREKNKHIIPDQVKDIFREFLKAGIQFNKHSQKPFIETILSDELRMMSSLNNITDYLKLGVTQSHFPVDTVIRSWVWGVYHEYLTYLLAVNEVHEDFYQFNETDMKTFCFSHIVFDEAHLASANSLIQISKLSRFGYTLCYDGQQSLSSFSMRHALLSHFPEMQTVFLPLNYRSEAAIERFLHRILAVQSELCGLSEKRDVHDQSLAKLSEGGGVSWLTQDDLNKEVNRAKFRELCDSAQFAVIVIVGESASLEEIESAKNAAKALFPTPLIFTQKEVQGLEYDTIAIVYALKDVRAVAANKMLSDRLILSGSLNECSTLHRSGKKIITESMRAIRTFFQAYYVAASRARSAIYHIESGDHTSLALQETLSFSLTQPMPQQETVTLDSNERYWYEEAKRLVRQGHNTIAKAILEQHCHWSKIELASQKWNEFIQEARPALVPQKTSTTKRKKDARSFFEQAEKCKFEKNYAAAIEYYEQAIELGSKASMNNCGYLYEHGLGCMVDYLTAIKLYEKAIQLGSVEAMVNRARIYEKLGPENYPEAIRLYDLAISLDNVDAMINRAGMHERGRGGPQDLQAAIALYERAIQSNSPVAMNNLGVIYEKGIDGVIDYEQAISLYDSAIQLGLGIAMTNRARMYQMGLGGPADYAAAIDYYDRAIQLNHTQAMNGRAYMHEQGMGGSVDHISAIYLYERAIECGCPIAMNNRAVMHQEGLGGPVDYAAAIELYERAIQLDYPVSMNNLAVIYQQGVGGKVDYAAAIKLYERAIQLDYPEAMNSRAEMYEYGIGCPVDHRAAIALYEKASNLGHAAAKIRLAGIYEIKLDDGVKQTLSFP